MGSIGTVGHAEHLSLFERLNRRIPSHRPSHLQGPYPKDPLRYSLVAMTSGMLGSLRTVE